MDIEKIIGEARCNNIENLLGNKFELIDYNNIIIYGEYSISPDTNYIFLRSKPGMKEIEKVGNINYEKLCSLKELIDLINFYLGQYDKKTDEILVIDIIDHLTN